MLRTNLLAEAQFSQRRYKFDGVGGTSTAIVDSPFFTLTQDLGHYNAPYFDATDPEDRNNRQLTGNLTYFEQARRPPRDQGRLRVLPQPEHRRQLAVGHQLCLRRRLRDRRRRQRRPRLDRASHPAVRPRRDAARELDRRARRSAERRQQLVLRAGSLERSTARLGRPRLALRARPQRGDRRHHRRRHRHHRAAAGAGYDVKGDGHVVSTPPTATTPAATTKRRSAATPTSAIPTKRSALYTDRPGRAAASRPGFNPANYEIVLRRVPDRERLLRGRPVVAGRQGVHRVGWRVDRHTGLRRSQLHLARRRNLIEDFINQSNGFTDVVQDGFDFGTFTNIIYRNTISPTRRYQALVFQGRYNLMPNWTVNGFWTVQLKNDGNYEGEAANQPGAPGAIGDYPEVFTAERHFPDRPAAGLPAEQGAAVDDLQLPHGARRRSLAVRSLANRVGPGLQPRGHQRSAHAAFKRRCSPAIRMRPSTRRCSSGSAAPKTFPGYGVVDCRSTTTCPVFRSLRPWLKFDFFNLFNNEKLIGFNTAVVPDPNSPLDAFGLPTGYLRARVRRGAGNQYFPASLGVGSGRTFRVALGPAVLIFNCTGAGAPHPQLRTDADTFAWISPRSSTQV